MEFQELVSACESAGYRVQSHVGIGGTKCLAISTPNPKVSDPGTHAILNIISEYLTKCNGNFGKLSFAQDLCETLRNARFIFSGEMMIIYWPHIKWGIYNFPSKSNLE